jgi:signal transduction histidine kinase
VIDSQSLEIGQQDRLKAEISARKLEEEQMLAYQKRLLSMDVELAMAEEQERRRIAADLHDHIGQYLAISRIKLMSIRYAADPEMKTLLDEVLDMIKEMSKATRTLTMELSPSILFELGLQAALDWLAEHIASPQGLVVEFKWVDDCELSNNMNTMIFRIARELLLNVVKHAQASRVLFTVRSSDGYRWISIEDDGIGFDVSALDNEMLKGECFGLFSIRERLKPVNGRFEIQSVKGQGTTAMVGVPLNTP